MKEAITDAAPADLFSVVIDGLGSMTGRPIDVRTSYIISTPIAGGFAGKVGAHPQAAELASYYMTEFGCGTDAVTVERVIPSDASLDDVDALARLLLFTLPERQHLLGGDLALHLLKVCAAQETTSWSYRCCRVVRVDNRVVGVSLSYPVREHFARSNDDKRTERRHTPPWRWPALQRCWDLPHPTFDPSAWLLDSLAVDPRWRRQGLGSLLIADTLERAAPIAVELEAAASNAHAVDLYRRLGFVVIIQRSQGGRLVLRREVVT